MPKILVANGDGFCYQRDLRALATNPRSPTSSEIDDAKAAYKARRRQARLQDFATSEEPWSEESFNTEVEATMDMGVVHGQIVDVFSEGHAFGSGELDPEVFKIVNITERELEQLADKGDFWFSRQKLKEKHSLLPISSWALEGIDFEGSDVIVDFDRKHKLKKVADKPDRDHGKLRKHGSAGTYALRKGGADGLDGETASYSTLAAWQTAHKDDDLTGLGVCKLVCYSDWGGTPLDESFDFDGWAGTTSSAYPWIIGRSHVVSYGGSFTLKYTSASGGVSVIELNNPWARVERICISTEGCTGDIIYCLNVNCDTASTSTFAIKCLCIGLGSGTSTRGVIARSNGANSKKNIAVNCIMIGCDRNILCYGSGTTDTPIIFGCTSKDSAAKGIEIICANATGLKVQNCISVDSGTVDYDGVSVNGSATVSKILTSDATSPDGASLQNKSPVFLLDGHPAGVHLNDCRLHPDDEDAALAGDDLSSDSDYALTVDVDGRDRPSGSAQTIGASEPYTDAELEEGAERSYEALKYSEY